MAVIVLNRRPNIRLRRRSVYRRRGVIRRLRVALLFVIRLKVGEMDTFEVRFERAYADSVSKKRRCLTEERAKTLLWCREGYLNGVYCVRLDCYPGAATQHIGVEAREKTKSHAWRVALARWEKIHRVVCRRLYHDLQSI